MTHGFTYTTKIAHTTRHPLECEGARCRQAEAAGRARDLAVAGSRLCPTCRLRLTHDLRRLPRLYDECGQLLTGADRPRDRTSGGPLPGMPFNTAAAEARSLILGTLRSWAVLVIDERGVRAPRDTSEDIVAFLLRHTDWLVAHEAVGELSDELAQCVRRARRVIDPAPRHRTPAGGCVVPDCAGVLTAAARREGTESAVEVRCDTDPTHRWSGQEWLRRGARSTPEQEPAVRWMTARDIAALWGIAPGSVYRRASEDRWRRQTANGRTYYHAQDIHASLGARA
ncbi:hypothetical protein ACFZCL_12900 [Streptomyces sp. NPDC008159]|uniref:hypothetical protein n=1 Tax=Streptomyces sp. NPDC008159 TaxID=3364817 RepID=UPI0036E743AD